MQAVILAAGDGGRLAPLTLFTPKPLVKVLGRPMLDYTVEALERAGVKDVIIVTGYKSWRIKEYLLNEAPYKAEIILAHNPEYEKGNAISLLASHGYIRSYPFILTMADHLLSPELISEAIRQSRSGGNFLAVDFDPEPQIVEEATKVWVDGEGRIRAVGKDLPQFNGVDTGLFILSEEIFSAIKCVVKEKGDCELSDALNYLIKHGSGLRACDVSGCFWMDVDTFEDLKWAEIRLIREARNARRDYIPALKPEVFKAFGPYPRPNTSHSQFYKFLKLSHRAWGRNRFPKRPKLIGWDFDPDSLSNGRG
jgi:choline kinase